MITPNQIKEKRLSTSSHGYDIDETNSLLEEIAKSYSAVYEENKELYRKMEILANKVVEYRKEEDSIKEALISAQKTAGDITKSAKESAEKLISDARDYVAKLTKDKTQAANAITAEAQAKADGILNNAKNAAQEIMTQVKESSSEIISKTKEEKAYQETLISKLKTESEAFRANLISLYEAELNKIRNMSGSAEPAADDEAEEAVEEAEEVLVYEKTVETVEEETVEIEIELPEEEAAEEEPVEEEAEEIPAVQEEIEEIEEIPDVEEIEEVKEIEEIEEIIEIPETDGPSMIDVDIDSAVKAFSSDEITPIEGHPVTEITEEPEMEPAAKADDKDELPFESFFNVKHGETRTNEKLSLIPPDDFEVDDDDDDLKFRGFFKKKKK